VLLAVAAFALVLGIMKPLKLAGHPLVWIAASAVAAIFLIAKREQFRLKGTIAIALQLFNVSLFIVMSYLEGRWGAPPSNRALYDAIGSLLTVSVFPLGYLAEDPITGSLLIVANCYLWAQCVCWTIAMFRHRIKRHNVEQNTEYDVA
jgi:hypothetical protein